MTIPDPRSPSDAREFDDWIAELDEDVIQGEYGFERGEFTVYPEHWRPMFREGLTPAAAFKRALDAHGEARRQEEAERAANLERIKTADEEGARAWRCTCSTSWDGSGTQSGDLNV